MTQELRTIRLFGHLGKKFGKVHHYVITSPAEAVRAMSCTIPGFREYVGVEHAKSGFRVLVGGEAVGAEQLRDLSGGQEIRIVPVVRGAKSALGQIIIGAVLIAISGGFGAALMIGGGGWLAGVGVSMGISMVLGGVAGLLASPPDPLSYGADNSERPSSYLFGGAEQAMTAGGPVSVLYGRLEVPLTLISGGITPEVCGNTHFGMLGDGLGTLTGDGITTPLAASIKE